MYDKVCQKRQRAAPPFSVNLEKGGMVVSTPPPPIRAKVNCRLFAAELFYRGKENGVGLSGRYSYIVSNRVGD